VPSPEEVAAAVSRNVRRLRTARGWTLDVLAARSGVSKGMLVQIEQDRTNPSLGTLTRIAEAYGVTLGALVELTLAPVVRRVRGDEAVDLWRGAGGSHGRLLFGSSTRPHVELWRWSLATGVGHDADAHQPGTQEVLHVEGGTLTLFVDGDPHEIPAGDSVSFTADRPHSYRNDGDAPLTFVMVVQPPAGADEG
jgi:transcriptional regulator with XRE-family HTH domain